MRSRITAFASKTAKRTSRKRVQPQIFGTVRQEREGWKVQLKARSESLFLRAAGSNLAARPVGHSNAINSVR